MARKKKTTKAAYEAPAATLELGTATPGADSNGHLSPAGDIAPTEPTEILPSPTPAASSPASAVEPRPTVSVNLSDYSGGPSMHLLRSHRFRQMQIRFDQGEPNEQHLAMLHQAGWRDRSQSEGVWTKQIDPEARWQSVARMEQEFTAIANVIRVDKGLKPALDGMLTA